MGETFYQKKKRIAEEMERMKAPPLEVPESTRLALEAMERDPLTWGQLFFEKHFRIASPDFHYQLIDAAETYRFVAIAAPRGSAKSTLLAFLKPAHDLIFKRSRFILIISNTFKKAAMHLDTIKKELLDNAALTSVFPPIAILRDAEGDSEFRHKDGFETKILCKGVDQLGSIRGVKFRAYRPDLVIIDDLEDDELVKNPDRRKELREEFDEVLNQVGDNRTRFIIVGTILHDDSQLAKLVRADDYREFHKIILQAHLNPDKPNESSLWPEKWDLEYLKELRREKPNVYAKEMQNDPVAGTNVRFKKEDFRYWKVQDQDYILLDSEGKPVSRGALRDCRASVACDLAWSEKREADYCVLLPGYLTPDSEILVEDYIAKKNMKPDEVAEQLFVMVDRLEKRTGTAVPVGFEKSMLENVTQFLLKREMKKRNKFLTTRELAWDHDKNTRIEIRLSSRYAQHVIYHKAGMGELEHQLTRFPYGTHDDICDAMQSLVQLLQFPKEASKPKTVQDEFSWWREQAIKAKNPYHDPKKTGLNKKLAWTTLPAKISWR